MRTLLQMSAFELKKTDAPSRRKVHRTIVDYFDLTDPDVRRLVPAYSGAGEMPDEPRYPLGLHTLLRRTSTDSQRSSEGKVSSHEPFCGAARRRVWTFETGGSRAAS